MKLFACSHKQYLIVFLCVVNILGTSMTYAERKVWKAAGRITASDGVLDRHHQDLKKGSLLAVSFIFDSAVKDQAKHDPVKGKYPGVSEIVLCAQGSAQHYRNLLDDNNINVLTLTNDFKEIREVRYRDSLSIQAIQVSPNSGRDHVLYVTLRLIDRLRRRADRGPLSDDSIPAVPPIPARFRELQEVVVQLRHLSGKLPGNIHTYRMSIESLKEIPYDAGDGYCPQ